MAEQNILKQDVKLLKDFMEDRRRDLETRSVEERMTDEDEQVRRGRSFDRGESERERREGEMAAHDGFDFEDDEGLHDTLDDEDDTRSIATTIPHSLERVDEEDEDNLDSDHEQVDEPESVRPLDEDMLGVDVSGRLPFISSESDDDSLAANDEAEIEEEQRRQEDLNVGRPRTPEPLMGLVPSTRRTSLSSPLQAPAPDHANVSDIYEQVLRLSKQLASVIQVTKALEVQHQDAQGTIKGLESKVASLEQTLKSAEEALATTQASQKKVEEEPLTGAEKAEESIAVDGMKYSSLVDMMAEWKKNVEGQWSSVREEWVDERERLAKAREEFEGKLERVTSLQTTLLSQQQQIQTQFQQQQQQISALNNSHSLSHSFLHHNGDAIKHYGGLVTPPSPRSQSSDSGRYRRRRRRSSASRGNGRAGSSSPIRHKDEGEEHDGIVEEDADTDATLASSIEDDLEGKIGSHLLGEEVTSSTMDGPVIRHGNQLATPASSVGSLEVDIPLLNANSKSKGGVISLLSTCSSSEVMASQTLLFDTIRRALLILVSCVTFITTCGTIEQTTSDRTTINVQTAAGVVLLSIAAAAVLWKVKPE